MAKKKFIPLTYRQLQNIYDKLNAIHDNMEEAEESMFGYYGDKLDHPQLQDIGTAMLLYKEQLFKHICDIYDAGIKAYQTERIANFRNTLPKMKKSA